MQYTLATAGALEDLERWRPQPIVRIDDARPISSFRYTCFRVVSSQVTQACWFVAMVVSTLLCLAVQPIYDMGSATYTTFFVIQVVLVAFFWVRMLLQIVATGFIGRRHAFLLSFWNWVELAVNVFAILQVIPPTSGIIWMRAVSAARPLRLLFLYTPAANVFVVPGARYAPALIDVMLTFAVGWVCLSTIGTLVLRYETGSRCYVTATLQPGSAFDNLTLPVLVNETTTGLPALCGIGRQCVSPAAGFVDVTCIHAGSRPPPPEVHSGRSEHLSYSMAYAEYYFTYRNLGTALLSTLAAGTVDELQAELERWMILRGSGAALFPVAVVLLVAVACAAFLATFTTAYMGYKRSRFRDVPQVTLIPDPVKEPETRTSYTGLHTRAGASTLSASHATTAEAPPVSSHSLHGDKVSAATQTTTTNKNLSHSLTDELSGSPREHESLLTRTHTGNPFSPHGPEMYGPFVLSCTEEHPPRSTAPVMPPSFLGAWKRRGLCAALRRQMQTIPRVSTHRVRQMAPFVDAAPFVVVHIVLLLVNVVLLAIHLDPFASRAGRILMQTSSALALVLIVHAFFILLAYGPRQFVCCAWCVVEVCGGVTGILELAAPSLFRYFIVRGLRVLRVLPLIQFTSTLSLARDAWVPVVHLALTSTAVVALYTLVGMQIFSAGHSPVSTLYANFRTMWLGLLSTFIAAVGDGWSTSMIAAFELGRVAPGVLFYMSLLFWGFFLSRVVLITLLAKALHRRLLAESSAGFVDQNQAQVYVLPPPPPLLLLPQIQDSDEPTGIHSSENCAPFRQSDGSTWRSPFGLSVDNGVANASVPSSTAKKPHPLLLAQQRARDAHSQGEWHARLGRPHLTSSYSAAFRSLLQLPTNAFYIIPSHTALRSALACAFHSVIYHVFIFLAVVMGVVALFFETSKLQSPSARRRRALRIINIVYVVIFWLEMVLKCVAYGIVWAEPVPAPRPPPFRNVDAPRRSTGWRRPCPAETLVPLTPPVPYLREPLNWLDVAANGLAMGGIFYPPLRLGRVLRTARLLTSTERPNRTFMAALRSLVAALRVVPFLAVLYVAFALLGVEFFSKRVSSCRDARYTTKATCLAATTDDGWVLPRYNYDNFGQALLSVVAISLTHHWTPFMALAMGVGDSDTTPRGTQAGYYVIFFLAIVIVIRYLVHGFIMAFLAAHYSLGRSRSTSSLAATIATAAGSTDKATAQDRVPSTPAWAPVKAPGAPVDVSVCVGSGGDWIGSEFIGLLAPDRCAVLNNGLSRVADRILSSRVPTLKPWRPSARPVGQGRSVFDWACLVLTFIVCCFVAASFAHPAAHIETLFFAFDCVGAAVTGVDMVLRVVAYGVRHLCRVWYLVDIAVFALFVAGMCVPSLTFFRALLLVRLVRLAGLSMSLHPLARRTWSMLNAIFVYLILLFIFSVVATLLFGDLHLDGVILTEKQNFRTVIGSCLVLFTCSTSANWAELVAACAQNPRLTNCGGAAGSCGRVYQSVTFFVVFGIVVNTFAVSLCLVSLVDTRSTPSDGVWTHAFHRLQCLWRAYAPRRDLARLPLLTCLPLLREMIERFDASPSANARLGPRLSCGTDAHSHTALLARLRLTVNAHGKVDYTQSVVALLQLRWGMLTRDLSWFTALGAPAPDAHEEIAAKTFARLCEEERQSRATAEWLPHTADHMWQPRPRDSRVADEDTRGDLSAMDQALEDTHRGGGRIRALDLLVPKKTQGLPSSNLFLFNLD